MGYLREPGSPNTESASALREAAFNFALSVRHEALTKRVLRRLRHRCLRLLHGLRLHRRLRLRGSALYAHRPRHRRTALLDATRRDHPTASSRLRHSSTLGEDILQSAALRHSHRV